MPFERNKMSISDAQGRKQQYRRFGSDEAEIMYQFLRALRFRRGRTPTIVTVCYFLQYDD